MNPLPVPLMQLSLGAFTDLAIWQWVGLGFFCLLWFVGGCCFGAGFAAFVTDRKNSTPLHTKTLCPEWFRLVVIGLWVGAQILYFCVWATIPWWQVMIWGISIGIVFFALGEIAYKMGRPVFFVITAIIIAACWYTWPKPKEYALLARDTALVLGNDAWLKAQAGWEDGKQWWTGAKPPTLALAQAELESILQKWQKREWIPQQSTGLSNYKTYGDAHQAAGYELMTWSIGPGRELEAGIFEFKLSLEVRKYGNLEFRTYFPEKTVTVINFPNSENWAGIAIGGISTDRETDSLAEMERQLMEAATEGLKIERDALILHRQGRQPKP